MDKIMKFKIKDITIDGWLDIVLGCLALGSIIAILVFW